MLFCFLCFSLFSIAITLLRKERILACLVLSVFSFSSCLKRALPGLFSYVFMTKILQCYFLRVKCHALRTHAFKYTENFTIKKGTFSDKKKSDIFHISA